MNSYNAFLAGELAPANFTQDNLEQINPADVEEMHIAWQKAMLGHFARECKQPKNAKEVEKKADDASRAGTSKALVTQESDAYDWSDQVQELEVTLSHAFMAKVDEKRYEETENLCSISCIENVFKYRSHNEALIKEKLDAERRDISKLKELLSDKESNYRDAKHRIAKITLELEQAKTELSQTNIRVINMTTQKVEVLQVEVRRKNKEVLGEAQIVQSHLQITFLCSKR
ncbi:hypothetical protein E3N88_15740 [Mikania micrantha]|uniref:Uncharacterized protein n=1 Tax=Mikania micrantha TaxID=192012 RepID=A0A5N6NW98_9ASTR|nr:hypothetical protein E3N88_15740 [Mikania micrantha]